MKKQRIISTVCTLLLTLSGSVYAVEGTSQLDKLLQGFDTYSANFEQYTKDEKGRRGEVTSGMFQVQRPNKFRWETLVPFPQLIVSDGKSLWIYDEDLEQATKKPVNDDETNAAALILNGNIKGLSKKFNIDLTIDNKQEQLFQLSPKGESNFEKIQLFFRAGEMKELLLVDILSKETTLILSKPKYDAKFKKSVFSFKPPVGTDVIIESGDS